MLAVVALCAREAAAFPLSATPGDTLAVVAQRVYNRGENERVLAAANGLERLGAGALPAGTRIEVPTGRAADACREWRLAAPQPKLDPRELSPKLLAACSAAR